MKYDRTVKKVLLNLIFWMIHYLIHSINIGIMLYNSIMENLNKNNLIVIELDKYAVKDELDLLLQDKTTGDNIIFATDIYSTPEKPINPKDKITKEMISKDGVCIIQPRVYKSQADQQYRTKTNAEVFTPSWICNKMNNYCDDEWFEGKQQFNKEQENSWVTLENKIEFPEGKTWKDYIDSRRLEIACGEAPFIASRYDTATGKIIDLKDRIGVLDRKFRVICENAINDEEWLEWSYRALQSVYGYEYQGDSLLIARINVLNTFVDYYEDRFGHRVAKPELRKVANIICWNLWQMDGLTYTIPFYEAYKETDNVKLNLFDDEPEEEKTPICKIYDWRRDNSLTVTELQRRH